LEVTEKLGRVRVLESVVADTISLSLENCSMHYSPVVCQRKGNHGANALTMARSLAFRGWSDIAIVPLVQPTDNNLRLNLAELFRLLSDFRLDDKIHPLAWAHIQNFQGGVIVDGILGTGVASPLRGVAL
jgi:NAD(P)H-hydrate repair Nnr-like enzyme with NAD(P)H-hydrate epimerase domain